MTASLETLVVAAYIFADETAIPRPGPQGEMTDAELVALAVAQAAIGMPSDRQFLGLVGKVLPGWFPHLPWQSQYNRRLRRLAPRLAAVQLRVVGADRRGRAADRRRDLDRGRQLRRLRGAQRVRGTAAYGYCAAKSQYVWGMRLVLVTDRDGGAGRVHTRRRQREGVRAGA